jgi:hypothetical protein
MSYTGKFFEALLDLHSWINPKDFHIPNEIVPHAENLLGLYLNTPEDYMLVTDRALHWVSGEYVRNIPYDSIISVQAPATKSSRRLGLITRDAEIIQLPILNETEGVSDFYAFREFLIANIYYPFYSEEIEKVKSIESKADLIHFLEKEDAGWGRHRITINALRDDFPKLWQLEFFRINPEIVKQGDVWKMLALFLCRELSEHDPRSHSD